MTIAGWVFLGCVLICWMALLYMVLKIVDEERRSWAAERRELLNRIQAPERIPVEVPVDWTPPEEEPDDTALVGTTAYSDADFADLAAELGTDED